MNQCIRWQFCIWISIRKAHPQPKQLDMSWRAECLAAEFSNHAWTCCRSRGVVQLDWQLGQFKRKKSSQKTRKKY